MGKVIRLTENELIRLVKRIIKESDDQGGDWENEENELQWVINSVKCDDDGFYVEPYADRVKIDYDFDTNTITINYCEGDEKNLEHYKKKGLALAIGYHRPVEDDDFL